VDARFVHEDTQPADARSDCKNFPKSIKSVVNSKDEQRTKVGLKRQPRSLLFPLEGNSHEHGV